MGTRQIINPDSGRIEYYTENPDGTYTVQDSATTSYTVLSSSAPLSLPSNYTHSVFGLSSSADTPINVYYGPGQHQVINDAYTEASHQIDSIDGMGLYANINGGDEGRGFYVIKTDLRLRCYEVLDTSMFQVRITNTDTHDRTVIYEGTSKQEAVDKYNTTLDSLRALNKAIQSSPARPDGFDNPSLWTNGGDVRVTTDQDDPVDDHTAFYNSVMNGRTETRDAIREANNAADAARHREVARMQAESPLGGALMTGFLGGALSSQAVTPEDMRIKEETWRVMASQRRSGRELVHEALEVIGLNVDGKPMTERIDIATTEDDF